MTDLKAILEHSTLSFLCYVILELASGDVVSLKFHSFVFLRFRSSVFSHWAPSRRFNLWSPL